MANGAITKVQSGLPHKYGAQMEVRRNLRAWRSLYGIWRGRKILNPIQWQRKIRKEWDRKLP